MADIKIDLRGLSLVEVCKNYPEQVAAAIEQHHIDDQKPSTNSAMVPCNCWAVDSRGGKPCVQGFGGKCGAVACRIARHQ